MRKPVIGGNWKMNKISNEGVSFAKKLAESVETFTGVEVFICPPFTILEKVGEIIKDSPVKLGAQNMHWEESGAYTGEISADMLLDAGCKYVITGHSERRRGEPQETDEIINRKLKKALAKGLIPVLCIGETREERKEGLTEKIINHQLTDSLKDISGDDILKVIIAYEPVWAIGTGETATPQQAEDVHLYIRRLLEDKYNSSIAKDVRIQYGGSVKPDNMKDLINQENIDGALVGGASLDVDSFVKIVIACKF